MKRAIVVNDVQNVSKQGQYVAQFWPVALLVDDCILIDNNLAVTFEVRSAVLTRREYNAPTQDNRP